LHANHLRKFNNSVNIIGIIFDDDGDFGDIEYMPITENYSSLDTVSDKYDILDLSDLNEIQLNQLRSLLRSHDPVFDDKPGESKTAKHVINITEGFEPKPAYPYRIPDKLKAEVDKQIEQLLLDGKIQKSTSPYSHPIVCVSKPDGSIRVCCDFRSTNKVTINDMYPMPRADDLIKEISGSTYISNLDCSSGYW